MYLNSLPNVFISKSRDSCVKNVVSKNIVDIVEKPDKKIKENSILSFCKNVEFLNQLINTSIDRGVKHSRYLKPYAEAVDCHMTTIAKTCKNIKRPNKEKKSLSFIRFKDKIANPKKIIGEKYKIPNSWENNIFKKLKKVSVKFSKILNELPKLFFE